MPTISGIVHNVYCSGNYNTTKMLYRQGASFGTLKGAHKVTRYSTVYVIVVQQQVILHFRAMRGSAHTQKNLGKQKEMKKKIEAMRVR